MASDPRPLTRDELAKFLPTQRAIRAFEKLFELVPGDFETLAILVQEVSVEAGSADARAQQALDSISRLADAVELLALAPRQVAIVSDEPLPALLLPTPADDLSPPETPNELIDAPLTVGDNLTLPKTAGKGIRVDKVSPTFGWHDLLGSITVRTIGVNDPTFAVYRGSIRQFQFSNAVMNEVFTEFHIPHDYLPGSDIFIHAHWSQIVVDSGGPAGVPGDIKWSFDVSFAKGHNQAAFIAPVTPTVVQTASGTQYQHMIAEVQLSAAAPSASQLDSDNLEVDGIILVRGWRNPADAADTLNQQPFLHFIDIHYQTTNIGTKQKAPDFYT